MIAYADTGFLVSLYLPDGYSALATSLIRSNPVFLLNSLAEAEFLNAIQLAVFRKLSTMADAMAIYDTFSQHQRSGLFRSEPLGATTWEKAVELSRKHTAVTGTRTLDVLHVASALSLKPDVFFTFDQRQARLAKLLGLHVEPT